MSGNAYSFIVFAGNELNNIPRHYFMGLPLDPVAIQGGIAERCLHVPVKK